MANAEFLTLDMHSGKSSYHVSVNARKGKSYNLLSKYSFLKRMISKDGNMTNSKNGLSSSIYNNDVALAILLGGIYYGQITRYSY